jgi:transmembrane sensor
MKLRSAEIQSEIDARAREWFVRLLDEDVGREELLAWARWLDADSLHRAAYERVEDAWRYMQMAEVVAPTGEDLAQDPYLGDVAVSRWRKARRPRLKLILPIAASLAAVVALGLAGWLQLAPNLASPKELTTARARHMEASLQDGSHVHLGAMTTLKVAFRPEKREVGLVKGEALFQVAHDRKRPFVVNTPLAAITAIGTAFNVDVETHAVTLTVTEGVVSVAPDVPSETGHEGAGARSPIRIRAGQRLKMERDGAHLILALSDGGAGATWVDGRLEYRNTSLRSVIEDVNRYTTKPIVVSDEELRDLQYTGTVQLEEADNWLLGLPAAFPLTVELNDRGQFVLRQKTSASLPQESLTGGRPFGEIATRR